jgi:hypothetical protein
MTVNAARVPTQSVQSEAIQLAEALMTKPECRIPNGDRSDPTPSTISGHSAFHSGDRSTGHDLHGPQSVWTTLFSSSFGICPSFGLVLRHSSFVAWQLGLAAERCW